MTVSIVTPTHPHANEPCFYCGDAVTASGVHWLGATGSIVFHPVCLIEFAIRTFRDLHAIECANDRYITAPPALDGFRRQLLAEEGRR